MQPALAHDALTIAPTQLDFDATAALTACNDRVMFRNILTEWVDAKTLVSDAERRLTVRIRRSPKGEKRVDVTLTDAAGVSLGEHHAVHGPRVECHKVLYDTARAGARLLGAFEPPPPPEPCPVCPPPLHATTSTPCAASPAPRPTLRAVPLQTAAVLPRIRRVFVGGGVFLGMGTKPLDTIGLQASLGWVPSRHAPAVRMEMDGGWAPAAWSRRHAFRGDTVPLFASLCHVPSALRLCAGLATMFFLSQSGDDALHMMLAASFRLGTEFEVTDSFSIRADGFTLVRFWQRTFGDEWAMASTRDALTGGVSAMGMWSWE